MRETFGETTIKELTTLLKKDEISIQSNELGYIYSLIVSLKTYIDFLKSDEEKKDEYIIPVLNSISDRKVNIVVFEKDDDKINTKKIEYTNTEEYCFIIKEGHYYEPLLYRVNLLKEGYEISILSKGSFISIRCKTFFFFGYTFNLSNSFSLKLSKYLVFHNDLCASFKASVSARLIKK